MNLFQFDGKRDERECRIMWKNVLHPSINKEKWSAQETKELQELANKYNMRNWPAIAKELGVFIYSVFISYRIEFLYGSIN